MGLVSFVDILGIGSNPTAAAWFAYRVPFQQNKTKNLLEVFLKWNGIVCIM